MEKKISLGGKKYLFPFVLITLTIINLTQSHTTELFYDEAYYWVYSNFLDWGYFDHPPMIALYIYISNFFFSEELGVRFLSSIFFSFMIYILWQLIKKQYPEKKEHLVLFLTIVLSTFFLTLYGFISTPDTPLILFTTLFLFSYNLLLKTNDWKHYLFFTLSIVGLLYSKYMGVLVVFFTIMSNLSLLKNKRFWASIVMVFLLYLPHLHWQFVNDFPSIRYHLFERFSKNNSYDFQNTLLHLINQIALFGFTFPLVYLAFFKNLKSKGSFEKSLTFIVVGFISCFFFATFIGHVQLQWTLVIIIPLIIITFNFLSKNQKYIKLFNRLAFINILFIIAIRFLLANEGIIPIKLECHGNKAWAVALKEVTKDKEIIFLNSYTNPALFTFYTEKKASSHNSIYVRKSQYNILKIDDEFENKDILVERSLNSQKEKPYLSFVKGYKKSFHFSRIESYKPIISLNYIFENQTLISLKKNLINTLPVTINNPYDRDIFLKDIVLKIVLRNGNQFHEMSAINKGIDLIPAKSKINSFLEFKIPQNISESEMFLELYIRNTSKITFRKISSQLIKIGIKK